MAKVRAVDVADYILKKTGTLSAMKLKSSSTTRRFGLWF